MTEENTTQENKPVLSEKAKYELGEAFKRIRAMLDNMTDEQKRALIARLAREHTSDTEKEEVDSEQETK